MMIDSVAQYFKACPFLQSGSINANFLGEKTVEYSIVNVGGNPVIGRYADGGSLRVFRFIFASRQPYGRERAQNFENSRFYERLTAWIEQQDAAGILPQLEEGLEPLRIEVVTDAYLTEHTAGDARYQIACRLIYNKEGMV